MAGQTCAFEYISRNWLTKSVGGTSSFWTNDADTPLLDDQLIVSGTIWRWKQIKGLDYSEDYAKYERRINDRMSKDGGKDKLSLNGANDDIQPVVLVPAGNWTL